MNAKKFLALMIAMGLMLVLAIVIHLVTAANHNKDKIISGEDIMCVSSVCLDTQTGAECIAIHESIAHVAFIEDVNAPGAIRLVVRPTGKQCR